MLFTGKAEDLPSLHSRKKVTLKILLLITIIPYTAGGNYRYICIHLYIYIYIYICVEQ